MIAFNGEAVLAEKTISVVQALETAGFEDATIQHFGTAKDVLIRLKTKDGVSNSDLST